MKRTFAIIFIFAVLLCSCSRSDGYEEKYRDLKADYNELQTEFDSLRKEYEALKDKTDSLGGSESSINTIPNDDKIVDTPDHSSKQDGKDIGDIISDFSDYIKYGTSFRIGVILVGDDNEGYTHAHIEGIKKAAKANGIKDDQIIWFYTIGEDETCYDKCIDCVEQGCKLVITNSYGHQTYCERAAKENPDVQFVAMTGDRALKSGLKNFSNAFNKTYESRYVSGIVAGMKIKELVDAGKLTDKNYDANGNVKVGYVGAYPYAEVVSGYTGFYLGIKSVFPNVVMDVSYTNSWFSTVDERNTAEKFIAEGCVIVGQYSDSTGAPSACEAANKAGTVVYSVGYNVDMLSVAPTAALTSSTNNWDVYYTYAIKTALAGEDIATDWSEGYETGAVAITKLGDSCAAGTADAVAKAEADIKAGKLHVFDINTFTVGGAKVESTFCFDSDDNYEYDQIEAIKDGYYHESEYISAPSFSLRIDGITELND